jgi:YggT family protein
LHANAKRGKKQSSPNGNLMAAIITFVFFIIGSLLSLLWLAIIISAVLSWLFAFEVINPRNRAVAQISHALDRVTDPILRPFRRIIPPLGGIDISPIVVLLIITGLKEIILPSLKYTLIGLLG